MSELGKRSPFHEGLRNLLLVLTAVTMILVWLPFVRTLMDGDSYQWGNTLFGTLYRGEGLEGDLMFLGYQLAFGLTILWLGYRGAHTPFPLALLTWHGIFTASALFEALTATEPLMFQGDTLGIEADVTYVAPIIYGAIFALALIWSFTEYFLKPDRAPVRWGPANWILSAVFIVLLGAGYGLLSTGEAHGTTDAVGVVITIVNLFVFCAALAPWHNYVQYKPVEDLADDGRIYFREDADF